MEEFTRMIPSLDPIRLQLTILAFANDHRCLLQPCTVAKGSEECWLLDSLTDINSYLAAACLAVEETLSAKTTLRSCCNDKKAGSGHLVACFLAYSLLRHHACIQVLDLHSTQLPMSARHAVEMALGHSRCLEEVNFYWWYQEHLGKSRLSESLPDLASLQKLALNLLSTSAEAVANVINRNRGIRELELAGDRLCHKGLRKILKAIGCCHRLTSLHLNEIRVSSMNAKRLSQLLESPSCFLTKLSLYDVTSVVVDAVLESLRSNRTLEKLSLSCVRQEGMYALNCISALKTNQTLKTLQVHECLVEVSDLVDMLKINSTLEVLGLTVCQLFDADAVMLADAIGVNRTLQKLDVQDNRLSADAVTVFARSLAHNTCLQVIDMGYIYFLPDDEESLARVLRETKACSRILVSWSKAGLVELASALSDPQVSMHRLCLDWRTDMEVSTAIVDIFGALSVNTTVTELIIANGSGIDDAIGEQLALTLRSNTSLKHMSIKNYSRRHHIMVALLEALKDNSSMSTLCFCYSIESVRVATALCNMLEANRTIYSIDLGGWCIKGRSLLALAAAVLHNGVLLEFKLTMTCSHKHFAEVAYALQKNLMVMKRAVRFIMESSKDVESQCAFKTLNGKESLLQTLVKVTGKTETEVKAIIDAAAQRTIS